MGKHGVTAMLMKPCIENATAGSSAEQESSSGTGYQAHHVAKFSFGVVQSRGNGDFFADDSSFQLRSCKVVERNPRNTRQ